MSKTPLKSKLNEDMHSIPNSADSLKRFPEIEVPESIGHWETDTVFDLTLADAIHEAAPVTAIER